MSPTTVESLFSKLNSHWTPIAHHLYLKHECPSPLPRVGPLAELLNVTRQVCNELDALVQQKQLTAAGVAAAVASSGQQKPVVRLLGKLVSWLQNEPQEELLLNTELQDSLWQLLLVTLANMLRVAQQHQAITASFHQELATSGLFDNLAPALRWVLKQHPARCLSATAGAWLLLQETFKPTIIISSKSTSIASNQTAASTAAPGTAVAATGSTSCLAGQITLLSQVLQDYISQAYITLQQGPATNGGARFSHSNSRKQGSKDGNSSSSSDNGEGPAHSTSNTAAGATAVAESGDGSWQFSHPVCLLDDPSTVVFSNLLILLHVLQCQLLHAVTHHATAAVPEDTITDNQQQQEKQALPGSAFLQLLALADTALYEQTAAANSGSSSVPPDHADVLPVKDVTLTAARSLGIATATAAMEHIQICCKAFQQGCFVLTASSNASSSGNGSTGNHAVSNGTTSNTSENSSSSSHGDIDSVVAFKLVLEAILLNQQCGLNNGLVPLLELLLLAARTCSRQQMQKLIAARGQLLLQALSTYLIQQQSPTQQNGNSKAPQQQEQQQEQEDSYDLDADNAVRCVICAEVLIQLCPGRLAAVAVEGSIAAAAGPFAHQGLVDDELLGSLTEQDPACFYTIMDHLVRHVQPQSLQVLLPMSASFLTQSMTASKGDGSSQEQPESSSRSSGSKRSMVILSDYSVCRSFAAAVNGYSKSVVGPVLTAVGQQQQQQQGQQKQPIAATNGNGTAASKSNGDVKSANGHSHDHDHHSPIMLDQDVTADQSDAPISYVLPPLQKTAEWLSINLEDVIMSLTDNLQQLEQSKQRASSTSSNGKGDSSSGNDTVKDSDQQQAAAVVQTVCSASKAAACSLVLVTLLARAAVPVLQDLQAEVAQLPTAAAVASKDDAAAAGAARDTLLLPEETAINILTGLMFARAAYQTLCCRCYLSQVLNQLPSKVLGPSAAVKGDSSNSKGDAAAADTNAQVLKSMQAVMSGEGMPVGWSHLVQAVPSGVLSIVQNFQTQWPGDFVAALDLLNQMIPVQVAIERSSNGNGNAGQDSSSGSSATAATVREIETMLKLPAGLHKRIGELLVDLQHLFSALLHEVPLPVGCNNPACTNLEGVAEASLRVNKRCKECLACHYCSKECQKLHWKQHKAACKRLRSNAAVAAVGSSHEQQQYYDNSQMQAV